MPRQHLEPEIQREGDDDTPYQPEVDPVEPEIIGQGVCDLLETPTRIEFARPHVNIDDLVADIILGSQTGARPRVPLDDVEGGQGRTGHAEKEARIVALADVAEPLRKDRCSG